MPSDVRIWDGTAWVSVRGSQGPAGPSAVSTNAGQLAKLGTDNLILVASSDLDARYVNVSGDTMTGQLTIQYAATQLVVGGTGNTVQTIRSTDGGNAICNFTSGTVSGQLVQTGNNFNFVNYGAAGVTSFSQAGNGQIRFLANGVQALTVSGTGIGVTGNITSTGTAHSFQPNSILVSALSGLNADSLSDVTVSAPTAGQTLRWNGTAFVNAALSYADLTGTPTIPAAVTPSSTAGLADTAGGTVGVSALYARADHTHPIPVLKADDLSDVAVATPATGQVLRWNGTNFVNAALNFSDLSGTQTNPTINAPSILSVFAIPSGAEAGRSCIVLSAAPVASTTITGVQSYAFVPGVGQTPTIAAILGKVNTVSGVFAGGVANYSGWVAMPLGQDERHAVVTDFKNTGNTHYIRFYTASENSNWSNGVDQTAFTPQAAATAACNFYQASRTITAVDLGKLIVNNSGGSTDVTFSLPADSVFPVGTRLDFVDASSTSATFIQAPPSGEIVYSSTLNTGGGAGSPVTVTGRVQMAAPYFRITAIKTQANRWILFT